MAYDLVCFDLDGTLFDGIEYSWQLFHDAFGVEGESREEAKQAYFAGRLSYEEWARHDIGLWKGLGVRRDDFIAAIRRSPVRLMEGARETLASLKEAGLKLAVISGSIDVLLDAILPDHADFFDDVFLSRIAFDTEGRIVGIEPTKYDMHGKAVALKLIAKREGIPLRRCVFIGDHHNDVEAAKAAGLALAFNCKDEGLREVCDVCIEERDLRKVLPHILTTRP